MNKGILQDIMSKRPDFTIVLREKVKEYDDEKKSNRKIDVDGEKVIVETPYDGAFVVRTRWAVSSGANYEVIPYGEVIGILYGIKE